MITVSGPSDGPHRSGSGRPEAALTLLMGADGTGEDRGGDALLPDWFFRRGSGSCRYPRQLRAVAALDRPWRQYVVWA